MSPAHVRVTELNAGYGGEPALRDVSFAVAGGAIVAVLGPNGGGKTTLFRALLGELAQRAGSIELSGRPAYVPQIDRTRDDFPITALDVALMGAYGRTPWYRRLGAGERAVGMDALERVGMAEAGRRRFGTLSGGQRQRVLVARAIVQDAAVLLLDEPLSGVDAPSARRLEELFAALRDEGRVLLIATHDVAQAGRWDAVLCLNRRQVAYGAPATVLRADVVRETYGGELMLIDGRPAITVAHHAH